MRRTPPTGTASSQRSTSTRSPAEGRRTSFSGRSAPLAVCDARPDGVRARSLAQTRTEPTRPSPLGQLVDLAFPFSLYEQAPFVDKGIAAITLTSAGDRPPPAFGDTHLNRKTADGDRPGGTGASRLARRRGRAGRGHVELRLPGLDELVRGWAIVFILCAALLPCLAVIVDLFARLRRRHVPLSPALRSYRSRLGFLALRGAALRAVLDPRDLGDRRGQAARARALARDTHWPVAGLALFLGLLAAAWFFARDRLLPRRPLGDEDALAGQIGALLALAVISLLLVAMNPYSVLFVLPSLHAWIWLPQLRAPARGAPGRRARRRVRRPAAAPRLVRDPASTSASTRRGTSPSSPRSATSRLPR